MEVRQDLQLSCCFHHVGMWALLAEHGGYPWRDWGAAAGRSARVTRALLSPGSCPGDMFMCHNTQCVWKENPECDGQKDCADASDEKGCGE